MTVGTKESTLTDALYTVAINGSYNASRALSKWLHRGVRLTTEGFQTLPISEAYSVIGEPDSPVAAIHLPLAGDLDGDMLLSFPEQVALQLVDIIMQQPEGTSTEFEELEQSCLQETGNIVCSAYANSLSKWLKLRIEPSVPLFGHDMASSIIDPLLVSSAAHHDEVLVSLTDFLLDKQKLQWSMLLLPSAKSLTRMQERCAGDSVRQHALHAIAVNGAFNASRAMSKWLKRGVKISTNGFARVPLRELAEQFDEDTPIVALHLPLGEQLRGHALLAIPESHALKLADILMGQPIGTTEHIDDLVRSALEETGNIISSSFVNSWSTWLDMHIEPGSPQFVVDLPRAVVEAVVTEQALVDDEVFLARTDFIVDEQWLEWTFMLFPAPSAMRLIESSCE